MDESERRGYAKGYAAGKRKKQQISSEESQRRKENAFWQRAFLATLPAIVGAQNWARGEKEITTLKDRVRLASEFADEALAVARKRI